MTLSVSEAAPAAEPAAVPPQGEVTVWHVTTRANANRILDEGLEPRRGPRTRRAREKGERIYVFPDGISMEDALSNWLADEFPEELMLPILEIRVPASWVTQDSLRWEATIDRPVPAERVRVLVPDLDDWIGSYPDGVPPAGWSPADEEDGPEPELGADPSP